MTTAQDGDKVVSLTHRPPLPPGNTSGTHFYQSLRRPQGRSATGRIMSLKNSNDTIGNRTRDLRYQTNVNRHYHWLWVGLCLPPFFLGFVTIFIMGWWCQPHAQSPSLRTRVSNFVWVITLDLSGLGGPTSSIRYRQHSSRDHVTTLAPPLRQSWDTLGGQTSLFKLNY